MPGYLRSLPALTWMIPGSWLGRTPIRAPDLQLLHSTWAQPGRQVMFLFAQACLSWAPQLSRMQPLLFLLAIVMDTPLPAWRILSRPSMAWALCTPSTTSHPSNVLLLRLPC